MNPQTEQSPPRGRHSWFTEGEYADRLAALQRVLEESDLAGVVLVDPLNVSYFSGLVTPSFVLRSRPAGLLVPRTGKPTLVTARPHIAQAEAVTWLEEFEGFEGFEEGFVESGGRLLRRWSGAVGYEGSMEHRPAMTADGYQALRERGGPPRWVDVSAHLWRIRQVKSPAELAYLRIVGAATGTAFAAVQEQLHAGMTEAAVYRVFARALVEECGGTVGYFAMHSGVDERFRSSGWPTDRVIEAGDLVWLDVGAVYRGYWSDYTRMFAVGAATGGQRESYAQMHAANRALCASLRPGRPAEDVMTDCRDLFERAGIQIANASRIGHGIGTSITEPPSIIRGDVTPLVVGTALAIEPAVRTAEGYFVVEENVVVTESGYEFLSVPGPAELPVV